MMISRNDQEIIIYEIKKSIYNKMSLKIDVKSKEFRINRATDIFNFLYGFFKDKIIDGKDFLKLREMSIESEQKEYEIFDSADYQNESLFQEKLQYVLINKDRKFGRTVNTHSIDFIKESSEIPIINHIHNFTGFGLLYYPDGSFILGKCKDGWLFGTVRIYDKFYNLEKVIDNYDKFIDDFFYTFE